MAEIKVSTLKFLGKKGKTSKKARNSLQKKKARKSQKARKRRLGNATLANAYLVLCDPGRHLQDCPGPRARKCPTECFLSDFGHAEAQAPKNTQKALPRTSKFPIRLFFLSDTVWQTVFSPFKKCDEISPTQEPPPSPFWQLTRTMVWVLPGRKLRPWSEFPFLYRFTILLNSGGSKSPWSEFWSEFPHFMGMGVVPAPSKISMVELGPVAIKLI